MNDKDAVIALDVGSTNMKFSLIYAGSQNIIFKTSISTEPELKKIKSQLIKFITKMLEDYSGKHKILGVGVSIGGRINFNSGKIVYATENIKNLQNFNIKEFLNTKFSLPVIADNDGNAACWGEFSDRNFAVKNLCALTLGTGIGGGILVNGKLIRSESGRAGELGHMIIKEGGRRCRCGYQGCWESYAGQYGIMKTAYKFFPSDKLENLTVKKIYDLYDNFVYARKAIDKTGYYLALGIKNIVHIFDPELIVIGGGISRAGKVLLNSINKHLYDDKINRQDVKIELSSLIEEAGLIGIKEIFMSELYY